MKYFVIYLHDPYYRQIDDCLKAFYLPCLYFLQECDTGLQKPEHKGDVLGSLNSHVANSFTSTVYFSLQSKVANLERSRVKTLRLPYDTDLVSTINITEEHCNITEGFLKIKVKLETKTVFSFLMANHHWLLRPVVVWGSPTIDNQIL